MRLRSLESRIVALFLFLILAVQLAGFFAIRSGIETNARASIDAELVIGEHVFRRLLDQNAQKLTQGARLLAADYGFRQAVGTNDQETISSALDNHGARIGAAQTMLVGADHQIKATTGKNLAGNLQRAILALVETAQQRGNATDIRIVDNHPYQIVVVPVKAPVLVGWVVMAFPIDQKLISEMRELSSLQVAILTSGADDRWRSGVSTLSASDTASLAAQVDGMPAGASLLPDLTIGDSQFSARVLRLTRESGQTAIAVLQRSVSEAIAPYRQLQLTLLILTAAGIALAVIGSIVMARRITGPLRQLTQTARRLGEGDYHAAIAIRRDDEIGALSKSFERMRDRIASRELEIRRLAYWDTLTNLPNRAQFASLLHDAIALAKGSNRSCYVLMMDLDRFKYVNDVMGHSFGDALLRQVANRLKLQLGRHKDRFARLGGDEFAVLLHGARLDEALAIAAQMLRSLETPISLDDQTVDLGAGVGIAGFPQHGQDAETILSRAEVAMYVAKQRNDGAVVYDPEIDQGSQQSLSLLSELRCAIDHGQFRLHVQPKIMLASGKVVGAEMLVRWGHPDRGFIGPDDFVPFAEKTGFIRTLTRWVLEQSAALCSELYAHGLDLKLSVNLSTRDLLDPELPSKFADILTRYHVQPSSFCMEITESSIMDDPVRAQQTLEKLHAMGVELSIDDFGTGYSSLAYLKRLSVDELKIDKSFVQNMARDADDSKIVRSTIDLGHNMGLRVVAEGIESVEVWHLLVAMGCEQGQGYFMSRPMPSDQLLDWIQHWQAPQPISAAAANPPGRSRRSLSTAVKVLA